MLAKEDYLSLDFGTISDLIEINALLQEHKIALIQENRTLSYGELNRSVSQFANKLISLGITEKSVIAICASTSIEYVIVFLGSLRAGVAVAPLAPSSNPDSISKMLSNSESKLVFYDESTIELVNSVDSGNQYKTINIEPALFNDWLSDSPQLNPNIKVNPNWAFNLIYSSGTTGTPKGIVQPHSMRWAHVKRGIDAGYDINSVTIISTPLYSNTTLVSFFPAISLGGSLVLMKKFNALEFLQTAEKYGATHSMLVPVQYQRIMSCTEFDRFNLKSFKHKFCTSAPFSPTLKRDILERWPGSLTEYYGMTEGGGTVVLKADLFPHKLHTVGLPAATSDIRLIDEEGNEVTKYDQIGEVVGSSPAMMTEYYKEPQKTKEAEWFSNEGKRFIRTGDIGKFDSDGFLVLMDRKKDMIISGGFNIYPSDIEVVLRNHPEVLDAAVIGIPSQEWGESPVAFVTLRSSDHEDQLLEDIRVWVNEQVGKIQRLAQIRYLSEIPRSHIGKIQKKDLKHLWLTSESVK